MIDIQVQHFSLTEAMESYIKQKLEPIQTHYGDRILSINVHLSDINGPKGGVNKQCLIHIDLQKLPTVVVEDTKDNLYSAVDNCCQRAERAVRKSLERQQTLARKPAVSLA